MNYQEMSSFEILDALTEAMDKAAEPGSLKDLAAAKEQTAQAADIAEVLGDRLRRIEHYFSLDGASVTTNPPTHDHANNREAERE